MPLSTETAAWLEDLKKEGGLDDAAYATLKSTFEKDSVDKFVKGSALRQSDYSRNMAEVQKAQKAAQDALDAMATKEASVNKFQQDLAQWKTGAEGNYNKALQERETAERKANAALARLKTVAAGAGLDEAELLKDLEVTPPLTTQQQQQGPDLSQYLTKEQARQAMMESALIDASIHDVAQQYFDLTGKRLMNAAGLVEEAIKAGKKITDYAAEKYNFRKLESEQTEKAIQARIDAAVKEKETSLLSSGALAGNPSAGFRTDLQGSPALREGGLKAPGEGGGGVSAAIAAFQTGKFKVSR